MDSNKEVTKYCIKKADFFVAAVCLLMALVLAIGIWGHRKDGRLLCISYDGKIIMQAAVEEIISGRGAVTDSGEGGLYYLITYEEAGAVSVRKDDRPDVPSGISYNLLYLSSEGVRMEAADCRDQICVHHRPLTGGGESIICLPHRLVVELIGGEDEERTDGMVK